MTTKKRTRAARKVRRIVGPESDEFWNSRVGWMINYRKTNKATGCECRNAWESLAKVGIFDPRPNAGGEGRKPASERIA